MVAAAMMITAQARRLIAPLSSVLALAYLVVMVVLGAQPVRTHLIKFEVKGVMTQNPNSIVRATVASAANSVTFVRQAGIWVKLGESDPVSAELAKSINLAVKFMHTAEPVRIFKANEVASNAVTEFGLSTPSLSIKLNDAQGVAMAAEFGNPSSDGLLHYMRVTGRSDFYLMSRFVLREWQVVADQKR